MQQIIYRVNVYCDTLTEGANFYLGVPTRYHAEPDRISVAIKQIETPSFVKQIVVDNQPLSSQVCEASIDLYVTYQLRREPSTGKLKLRKDEEAHVMSFIDDITAALASLDTVDA